jgi:DNA-binding NarL/FixJ family response regulator
MLTEREKQVLFYLIQGLSNAQIGERIHAAENTVKHHVKFILKKWRCTRREHLIIQAVHRGLLKPDPSKISSNAA